MRIMQAGGGCGRVTRAIDDWRNALCKERAGSINLEDILDGGELLLTQQLRGGINYRDCSYLPSRGRDSRGEGVLVLKGTGGGQSTPSILNKQQSPV